MPIKDTRAQRGASPGAALPCRIAVGMITPNASDKATWRKLRQAQPGGLAHRFVVRDEFRAVLIRNLVPACGNTGILCTCLSLRPVLHAELPVDEGDRFFRAFIAW